jgi:hypothetical protein
MMHMNNGRVFALQSYLPFVRGGACVAQLTTAEVFELQHAATELLTDALANEASYLALCSYQPLESRGQMLAYLTTLHAECVRRLEADARALAFVIDTGGACAPRWQVECSLSAAGNNWKLDNILEHPLVCVDAQACLRRRKWQSRLRRA